MTVHPFPVAGGYLRRLDEPATPPVASSDTVAQTPGATASGPSSHTDALSHASAGRGGSSPAPATYSPPMWLDYERDRMLARADRKNAENNNG